MQWELLYSGGVQISPRSLTAATGENAIASSGEHAADLNASVLSTAAPSS